MIKVVGKFRPTQDVKVWCFALSLTFTSKSVDTFGGKVTVFHMKYLLIFGPQGMSNTFFVPVYISVLTVEISRKPSRKQTFLKIKIVCVKLSRFHLLILRMFKAI